MKVVILAGGFGTRISEESEMKPKPMIEIGGKPILWHIMKIYSHFGFNDFVICLGYKGYYIKEYFANYYLHQSDVTFDFGAGNECKVHSNTAEDWRVTLVDTGLNTMTGGRLKRVREHTGNGTFLMTYGDGVADIDIMALLDFHRAHGRKATVTATQPKGRFGVLDMSHEGRVESFLEKPVGDGNWINSGFFVFEPEVFDYIAGDATVLEREPLETMVRDGQLMAYKHGGFWKCMDTLRDKIELETHWSSDRAAWKIWEG